MKAISSFQVSFARAFHAHDMQSHGAPRLFKSRRDTYRAFPQTGHGHQTYPGGGPSLL